MIALLDRRSLRFRMLVLAALTIGLTLVVADISIRVLFDRHLQRRVAGELETRMTELAGSVGLDPAGRVAVDRRLGDSRYDQPLSGAYWQIAQEGSVVLHSRSLWDALLPLPQTLDPKTPYEITALDDAELYILARPIAVGPQQDRPVRAVLMVALDHREIQALSEAFGGDLTKALLAIALALFIGAALQMNIGFAPLRRLHEGVLRIRSGRSQRLGAAFPSEIKPLAEDLDRLLDQHEASLRKARDRAGALAHGFRTPLTILALEARKLDERGNGASADVLREQTETMRRHVEQELMRVRVRAATAGAGIVASGEGTDVGRDARRLVELMRRMPYGDTLAFSVDVPDDIRIVMDSHDFCEVLGNLLDNARKWAVSGVEVKAKRVDAESALVEVVDDGPGFADHARDNVRNRDGAGLGLGIVAEILAAYGSAHSVSRRNGRTVVALSVKARPVAEAAAGATFLRFPLQSARARRSRA